MLLEERIQRETDTLELSREAKTSKQKSEASQGEVDALTSAFRSEFKGGSKESKKEKKEPREETQEEKDLKSLRQTLGGLKKNEEKPVLAVQKLEKVKMASGIRQNCSQILEKVKKHQALVQLLIADGAPKNPNKALDAQ